MRMWTYGVLLRESRWQDAVLGVRPQVHEWREMNYFVGVLLLIGIIGWVARALGWKGLIEHKHHEEGNCWCEKEF